MEKIESKKTYYNLDEPPIINEMINRAIGNINTFKELMQGNKYDICNDQFVSACVSGHDFLKGIDHDDKEYYNYSTTKSLYLIKALADMRAISDIKRDSYEKQTNPEYKGVKGTALLKAELLCVALAKHNIPYFAAEYIASNLIMIRSISEADFLEAYELIEYKAKPDIEDINKNSNLDLADSQRFFGYINMRVSDVKSTVGSCLHEFYVDEVIDNESCEFDLESYFDNCAELESIYKEIDDENIEELTKEVIDIASSERSSLIHKLTPKQKVKRERKGLFAKRLAESNAKTC